MNSILILNLFSSFFLCGLIWTIQLVHYPFFIYGDRKDHKAAMDFHRTRISYIVIPVMLIELFTSAWLAFKSSEHEWIHIAGFLSVLLIWIITFTKQVPLHSKLSEHYNYTTIRKLVRSNWWRTLFWSIKSLLGLLILKEYLI